MPRHKKAFEYLTKEISSVVANGELESLFKFISKIVAKVKPLSSTKHSKSMSQIVRKSLNKENKPRLQLFKLNK